jgi:glutathione synthase/RimK-type ligase-like ATP-grasp enzyme
MQLIRLRAKYRTHVPHGHGVYSARTGNSNGIRKIRNKLNAAAKAKLPPQPAPPTMVIRNGKTSWR